MLQKQRAWLLRVFFLESPYVAGEREDSLTARKGIMLRLKLNSVFSLLNPEQTPRSCVENSRTAGKVWGYNAEE